MVRRSLVLAIVSAALFTGCAAEQTPVEPPANAPPRPWDAEFLRGPFPAVADFCKATAAAACEERSDSIVAIGESKQQQRTKDGATVQLVTVVTSDGKMQRAHLLLKREAELFALPPAQEYDPNDGGRHILTIRSAAVDAHGLFALTYGTETTSGTGDTARQEMTARQVFCRVAKDFPPACAFFETERSLAMGAGPTPVPELTAEVLVVPGADGQVSVTAHGQSGAEGLKLLSAPGEYKIAFP